MDKSALIALAERCEAAEGQNYGLEVEIFKAIHPEYAGYVQGRGGLVHPCDGSDQRVLSDVRPGNYTASLDAAMTLLPTDGTMNLCEISFSWDQKDRDIWPCAKITWYPPYKSGPDWHALIVAAKTLPLTICAAALRAIADSVEE